MPSCSISSSVNLFVSHFSGKSKKEPIAFVLHPWVTSEEKETEFLRYVVEISLLLLTPRYAKVDSVRFILRDILACAGELSQSPLRIAFF